ncbi:MAG TPA: lamin tail domain-containing protein [Verrucomicrobiales bacterium]|nr:lamin tail domain-containing protein [Verrucomicrobiales bacterium]
MKYIPPEILPMKDPFFRLFRQWARAGVATALFCLAASSVHARIVISELQAVNDSTLTDKEFGDYEDWIELHNEGTEDVNLEGWYLTDQAGDPFRWRFPDITLGAGRYLVIFTSGKNLHTPLSIFEDQSISKTHTNFKLTSEGEYLGLYRPDAFTIEHEYNPGFPPLGSDISYGLSGEDGALVYFAEPTPGQPNGSGNEGIGPIVTAVENLTEIPVLGEDAEVVIAARVIRTIEEIESVTLFSRAMFKPEGARPMLDNGIAPDENAGDGIYTASIPLTSVFGPVVQEGQMIRWRVEASGVSGNRSQLPTFHDPLNSEEYYGTVAADSELETSNLSVLHVFVENANAAQNPGRRSLFYLGEFYDNVEFTIHGQSSSGFPKKSFNIDFNSDHRFRYRNDQGRVRDIDLLTTWGDKSKVRNTLAYEMFDIGGVAGHFAFPVRVQLNGDFFATADFVEDADERYLERAGLDEGGALYKMYDRLQSTAQGQKKTRKQEDKSDLQALIDGVNRGSTDERIDYIYDNVDIPGMVNFLTLNSVINNTDYGHKNYYVYRDTEGSGEWVELPWDVDLSLGRLWTSGANYFYDPIQTTHASVEGHVNGNALATLFMQNGDFNTMIHRRMRTMMDYFYGAPDAAPDSDYFMRRLDELVELIDPEGVESDADLDYEKWGSWGNRDTMRAAVDRLRNEFFPGRRDYIYSLAKLPGRHPTNIKMNFVEVDFNPASGNQEEEYIALQNTTGDTVDASGWTISGAVDYTFRDGTVLLTGSLFTPDRGKVYVAKNLRAFRARSEGPQGGMKLLAQGGYDGQLSARGETLWLRDREGNLLAEYSWEGNPSAAQEFLRITELHAAPEEAEGSGTFHARDFEFIELRNTGTAPLDLAGVRISDGISFVFGEGSVLAPGAYGVVVSNRAAFESRYGVGINVLGEYEGWLDNGGERLQLSDAVGENILKFSYDRDWFGNSGAGHSLQIVNDGAAFDTWNDEESWVVSEQAGGTPGAGSSQPPVGISYVDWATAHFTPEQMEEAAVAGPEADPNADGVSNLAAYAFGMTPWSLTPEHLPALAAGDDGAWRLTYRRQAASRDLNYMAQWSPDFEDWRPSGGVEEATVSHPDGTQSVELRIDDPQVEGSASGAFRMRVYLDDPLFIGPPVLK